MKCHLKINVTQNYIKKRRNKKMSLKWNVTEIGMSLKFNVTKKGILPKIEGHSKCNVTQN